MKIVVNEKIVNAEASSTVFSIRDEVKKDANVVILNGFPIKEDCEIKDRDKITLIKKGEIPSSEELEHLLVARHTPGVHQKIKNSSVGIGGLGGLGSNIAISLARMGVGKLILVDFDVVEPSNLNRQQYFVRHLGMYKTDALKELIGEINPYVDVEIYTCYLDENNIEDIFKSCDVVVEAFDCPKSKATLTNVVLQKMQPTPIVAASGLAGCFSSNTIQTERLFDNFYLIGDGVSEAKPGCGLMAPRVAIAANHQANMVVRLLLGEKEI